MQLSQLYSEYKINKITFGLGRLKQSIQIVTSAYLIDHQESRYWAKVVDAEEILLVIENLGDEKKFMNQAALDECVKNRLIHECLQG